ncbi:MAG TPA: hypothetical protein VFA68_16070 [Terriglobales bacterium]|nr:hypothetical protein [Terriglobales bacterium]
MQGLMLAAVGAGFKTEVSHPESILHNYDLVFAKARCALEALCVGCAVILCDFPGSGPMVMTANLDHLRRMNFGRGVLTGPLDSALLASEIARYDARDAFEVSRRLRAQAGLEHATTRWLHLYSDVIAEMSRLAPDPQGEQRALESYLRWRESNQSQRQARRMQRIHAIPLLGKPLAALAHRALGKRSGRISGNN